MQNIISLSTNNTQITFQRQENGYNKLLQQLGKVEELKQMQK